MAEIPKALSGTARAASILGIVSVVASLCAWITAWGAMEAVGVKRANPDSPIPANIDFILLFGVLPVLMQLGFWGGLAGIITAILGRKRCPSERNHSGVAMLLGFLGAADTVLFIVVAAIKFGQGT